MSRLLPVLRSFATSAMENIRLEVPPGLRTASLEEVKRVLPFCYEIGSHRHRSFESRGLVVRYNPSSDPAQASTSGQDAPPSSSTHAAAKRPSDSYVEMIYPFSTNPLLREQYQRFTTEKPRLGLLLEDMDTFAGDLVARHTGLKDRIVLTAFVDKISWLDDAMSGDVKLNQDMKMAGEVTWVGKSSMEVLIEVSSKGLASDLWRLVGFARFVLVSRTLDMTGSKPVTALQPVTETEQQLYLLGQEHMLDRQRRREEHWERKPPNAEEVAMLHYLIQSHHLHTSAARNTSVPMRKTLQHTSLLMHSQDRNSFGVIFGGYLLRVAFEHAFAAAALYAGEYCDPVSMEDVAFLLPVPIGSLMRLTAQVVFTEGPILRVHVHANKLQPGAPEQAVVTNLFSYAFMCRGGPVKPVIPESMVEAMEYVLGHRQHAADPASKALLQGDEVAASKL